MSLETFAFVAGTKILPRPLMFNLDPQPGEVTLVYPFWAIRRDGRVTLLDTSIPVDVAAARGLAGHRETSALLGQVGIALEDIQTVILSHLHYDHYCGPERFPNAEFVVQRDEVDYFTGCGADYPAARDTDRPSIAFLTRLRADGRLRELDGDAVVDDLLLVHVGGHSPGLQIVVLEVEGRRVVLAGDAAHFYDNVLLRTPTSVIHSYAAYQRGFSSIEALAHGGTWFPGHDAAMLEYLSPVGEGVYRL